MGRYLAFRLLRAIPTLILVAVMVFALVRLIPGDPAQVMLGDSADREAVAALRADLGLDRPAPLQFLAWATQIAQGDLGHSLVNGLAVGPLIAERFQLSALIVLAAVSLAVLVAVPLGTFAAWRRDGRFDVSLGIATSVLMALPSFWLALLLLLGFGLKLKWLPVLGTVAFGEDPLAALRSLVLPVLALALAECGVLIRMARASALDVMDHDYITHARAKGLSDRAVVLRHVLPNAFGPTWTLTGLILAHLLGGAAVIETVFTLPGLGRLLVDAVFARDYPVIQGCLLLAAFNYVLVNLIVDLVYPLFDPKVLVA